ncbi:A-kinase anchor protein 7 isoform gamma like protein [Argiope bruennichi]|uniref:A-kinase anchor protein 7 isoform gamma like protein n=1 Tax=Argiope bruennichi TaxID=94029 RepID=A0A8T0FPJ3_ARGBR|nr:A-kinase anchor protein 7 isoform gamma like protein [Argiope bruennichi]
MDYLSKTFCLCFLSVKTVQILGNKLPFLSRTRFLRFGGLIQSYHREFPVASVECSSNRTIDQSDKEITMGKIKKAFPSETSPKKKLKVEATEEMKLVENKRKRPNYFVAVQITNPDIHKAIQRIQDHIVAQNMQFNVCMNSIATLHITLMVMNIIDTETHDRALKALRSVYEEYNGEMCKNPLRLEFCGLGHFRNRVLYAKITKNESFERLCGLAERVRKHFADFEISSTDEREFNPHLTIAKIDFSKKKQKVLKKIEPSFYETFVSEYIGCETVVGIQLLSMTSPKNDAGYYCGENLIFESIPGCSRQTHLGDINKKKMDIRMKIADLTQRIFK